MIEKRACEQALRTTSVGSANSGEVEGQTSQPYLLAATCSLTSNTCWSKGPESNPTIDPPPDNSPNMHSRMVCEDPKIKSFPRGNFRQFLSKISNSEPTSLSIFFYKESFCN